jgi:hypothetical protein
MEEMHGYARRGWSIEPVFTGARRSSVPALFEKCKQARVPFSAGASVRVYTSTRLLNDGAHTICGSTQSAQHMRPQTGARAQHADGLKHKAFL